jgi:phage-related protein
MNVKWNIEFYIDKNGNIPVKKFIEKLPAKHAAKAIRTIDLLEQYGIELPFPHTSAIQGDSYKGLWELRIKFSKDISRIFYFLPKDNTFILLHGFVKKDNKTSVIELEIAKNNMNDYLRRG